MNKGKVIVFSIAGFLVLMGAGAIYMLLSAGKSPNAEKQASLPPVLNSRDSLTYKDMIEFNNNKDYQKPQQSTPDTTKIKTQIASMYGVPGEGEAGKPVQTTQTTQATPYHPYGNKSMYTVPAKKERPQPQRSSAPSDYNPYREEQRQSNDYSNTVVDTRGKQIKAKLISQKQYVLSGETLTFRLLEPTVIGGKQVSKGQLITGVTQEQGNRLIIKFTTIKIDGVIVQVQAKLFGDDGLEGLAVEGSNDPSYGERKGGEIAGNAVSNVPVVGGIVSGITRDVTNKSDNRIKVTPVTCTLVFSN